MLEVITNSQFQKGFGKISENLQDLKKPLIVAEQGQPKMFVLPYFKDGNEALDEYFENYEMWKNKKKLQKKYKKSSQSGESKLMV